MSRYIQPFHNSFFDLERHFFDELGGFNGSPAMDVYQDKDNVIVETALPAIDPNNIEISIENDVLTISGHSEHKEEKKKEDYYRKEIRRGSFSRSVVLPMAVKSSGAQADYEKGVLKVTLPKSAEAKPKKIAVKVKGK